MFKKRTNKHNKINLEQEAAQIEDRPHSPQPLQPEQPCQAPLQGQSVGLQRKRLDRARPKQNFMTLQILQTSQLGNPRIKRQEPIEIDNDQTSTYLNQIRKMRPEESKEADNQGPKPKMKEDPFVQQLGNSNSGEHSENDLLQVEEDLLGGLSPEREQDPFNEDYQEELIRRTLTKHNYEQMRLKGGPNLFDLKATQARDRILERIQKVTPSRVSNSIKRDLAVKEQQYKQLLSHLQSNSKHLQSEKKQLSKKEGRLKQLEEDLEQTKRVIQFVFYFGDRIKEFEMGAILRQYAAPQTCNFEDVQ